MDEIGYEFDVLRLHRLVTLAQDFLGHMAAMPPLPDHTAAEASAEELRKVLLELHDPLEVGMIIALTIVGEDAAAERVRRNAG